MEEYMKGSMRKLALWHTRTFKPIMTHDELEPIMATLGFVGLHPTSSPVTSAWKEYVYTAGSFRCKSVSGSEPPPKPRLPYPKMDGLHIYTYRAFVDAVCFYLEMCDISDFFHIRGMPLQRIQDKSRKWRKMEEDNDSVFVYREGTLEQATHNLYNFNKSNGGNNNNRYSSFLIRNKGNAASASSSCIVPLEDIIV